VAGGQRQLRGDESRSTQISTGGFQLANGIPRRAGRIGDTRAVVMTKKQRLYFFFDVRSVDTAIVRMTQPRKEKKRSQYNHNRFTHITL